MNPALSRPIGKTRFSVTQLGFGCAGLSGIFSAVTTSDADLAVRLAYEGGVRYFDVAPLYGYGLGELRLGHAIASIPRAELIISTKVGYKLVPRSAADAALRADFVESLPFSHVFDFSRDAVLSSLESSLERLGTDRVDIVLIHDPDESASMDFSRDPYAVSHFQEVMEGAYPALHELRAQGTIGAIGVGMNQCPMLVDFARAGDFDCFLLAGRYTLLNQDALEELLLLCFEKQISILVGSPYQSGILASGAVPGARYNYVSSPPAILERVRRMETICKTHNVSLQAAALQFPLGHPAVVSVLPGASSPAEVRTNLEYMQEPIPASFWDELKREGLLDVSAPVPP